MKDRVWQESDLQAAQQRMGKGGVVWTATPSKGLRQPDECNLALISAAGSNPAPSPLYRSKWEAT